MGHLSMEFFQKNTENHILFCGTGKAPCLVSHTFSGIPTLLFSVLMQNDWIFMQK